MRQEMDAKKREEYLAMVSEKSHEMKNNLAAISGYAELMENGMIKGEKDIMRVSANIHQSADELLETLNELVSELRKED